MFSCCLLKCQVLLVIGGISYFIAGYYGNAGLQYIQVMLDRVMAGGIVNEHAVGQVHGFHLFDKPSQVSFLAFLFQAVLPAIQVNPIGIQIHFTCIADAHYFYLQVVVLRQKRHLVLQLQEQCFSDVSGTQAKYIQCFFQVGIESIVHRIYSFGKVCASYDHRNVIL
ncbi:hypothetical protein D3C87_1599720 [compost metagenome]